MATIIPNDSFVETNFNTTVTLSKAVPGLVSLLSEFSERYAVCPASTRRDFFSCFPGGLAYHNLQVMKWISKFSAIMEKVPSKETMIKLAVLHHAGKLGSKEKDYYVRTGSSWHDEKGIHYEINKDLQYMKVPHRSIYLATEFGISLSEEEYLAILLQDSLQGGESTGYSYKEPQLALILHNALQWSIKVEKDNVVNWPG